MVYGSFRGKRLKPLYERQIMRYYTAEWYLKSRCTGLHLRLRSCTPEEARSHGFYEKIFAIFADEVRFECEQIKNTSFDVFAEDRTESEEFLREEFNRRLAANVPEEAEFYAAKQIAERINELKFIIPETLSAMIPDMRIFALGYADEKTVAAAEEYAMQCRHFVQETDFRFEEDYPALTEPIPDEVWQEYGFKGGRIRRIIHSGSELVIHIDPGSSGSDVTAVHLENAGIERLDNGFDGADWISNEIYLENGIYTLCALCRNGRSLPEFILHGENVFFDYDR